MLPLPFIHYEGERFFLRGLTGGIHVFKNDTHELSVNLSYMPQQYDAGRSDSWEMRQLDNRYSTLLAGASYSLKTQWGIGKIGFGADILDNSNGFIIDASYTYPFALGPVTLMPIGGVLCTSSQHNDYYYGVSNKESRKSGLKSYEADSGFSSYVGFDTKIDLSENWHIFMNTRATLLSDEITDSPMVDEDVKYSFDAGITYRF